MADSVDDPKPEDYAVGYGKPPERTRFRKGQSGNPKGRPKGHQNMATIIREVTDQPVRVTMNGKTRRMPAFRAIVQGLTAKALKGDPKAAAQIIELRRSVGDGTPENVELPPDLIDEQAMLESLLQRRGKNEGGEP